MPHLSMPKRGPKCKLGYHRLFNLILWVLYTGMQWKCLPVPTDTTASPAIHYTTVYKVFARWADDGSLWHAFVASVRPSGSRPTRLDLTCCMATAPTRWPKKAGDGIWVIPATNTKRARKSSPSSDNHGYVLAPLPVAPVNEADTVLLPEGLRALKQVAKQAGLELRAPIFNLDGGFDSTRNRKRSSMPA